MEMTNNEAELQIKKMKLVLLMIISFGMGVIGDDLSKWISYSIFAVLTTYAYFTNRLERD